jgi:hypothetical protein
VGEREWKNKEGAAKTEVLESGKHSTRTLSLVQNRVRFKKEPAKKNISLQEGRRGETHKCTIFRVKFSFSSCFDPLFPFS